MADDYYIDIEGGNCDEGGLWLSLLLAAEGGFASSFHEKAEAEALVRTLQAEAEEKLRARRPEAKRFPHYTAVRLPF